MNFEQYRAGYLRNLIEAVLRTDWQVLSDIVDILLKAYKAGKTIFVFGNGGSASTAQHIANDLGKGTQGIKGNPNMRPFKVVCLVDNISLLTAWSNDTSFDRIFAEQIRSFAQDGDVVIAISASGNSANIVEGIHAAKAKRAKVIGLTGFDGGKLKKLADITLVVDDASYGRVEDIHLMINHIITNYLYEALQKR